MFEAETTYKHKPFSRIFEAKNFYKQKPILNNVEPETLCKFYYLVDYIKNSKAQNIGFFFSEDNFISQHLY